MRLFLFMLYLWPSWCSFMVARLHCLSVSSVKTLAVHSFIQFMRGCHFGSFGLQSVWWLGCSFSCLFGCGCFRPCHAKAQIGMTLLSVCCSVTVVAALSFIQFHLDSSEVCLILMRNPNFNVILIYFVLFYILLHPFPFPFYLFLYFIFSFLPESSYAPLPLSCTPKKNIYSNMKVLFVHQEENMKWLWPCKNKVQWVFHSSPKYRGKSDHLFPKNHAITRKMMTAHENWRPMISQRTLAIVLNHFNQVLNWLKKLINQANQKRFFPNRTRKNPTNQNKQKRLAPI